MGEKRAAIDSAIFSLIFSKRHNELSACLYLMTANRSILNPYTASHHSFSKQHAYIALTQRIYYYIGPTHFLRVFVCVCVCLCVCLRSTGNGRGAQRFGPYSLAGMSSARSAVSAAGLFESRA